MTALLFIIAIAGCVSDLPPGLPQGIPMGEITVANETDELLAVAFNVEGGSYFVLSGETIALRYQKPRASEGSAYDDDDDPFRIRVYDSRGCFARIFNTTNTKLREDADYALTIEPADLTPPDERRDCDLGRVLIVPIDRSDCALNSRQLPCAPAAGP
ncbi:MAG: hypothetical protein J4N26_01350 [Chloroflexi bacterium]|nr:hypothetical protein [Chloroflexota bacterium]